MATTKVIKKAFSDQSADSLNEYIFNAGNVDLAVAYDKYRALKHNCLNAINVLEQLAKYPVVKVNSVFEQGIKQINEFCVLGRRTIPTLFDIELDSADTAARNPKLKKAFLDSYEVAKKSHILARLIVMCSNLAPYRTYISGKTKDFKPTCTFIKGLAGNSWTPFEDIDAFDFKALIEFAPQHVTEEFVAVVLSKLYGYTLAIHRSVTTPDVDITIFTKDLGEQLKKLSKHPKLSRCKGALAKVRDSLSILQDKFGDYYKDVVVSGDQTMLMQNFILDVSDEHKKDPKLILEFRHLMQFYKEQSQAQGKAGANDAAIRDMTAALDGLAKEDGVPEKPVDE